MNEIKKEYNFLNQSEIKYLITLSENFVVHQFDLYHQTDVDKGNLQTYFNTITKYISENFVGEYQLKAMEMNRVTESDIMDWYHQDDCDLTFVTYFEINFEGGEFEYLDEKNSNLIEPEANLTLIMDKNLLHRIRRVKKGERFSLVSFFILKPSVQKKIKTFI
jgi:hypothetical protein